MIDTNRVFSLEIQAEHIRIMFRLIPIALVIGAIITPFFVLTLWNTASHRVLLAWVSIAYVGMIIRWFFIQVYQRHPPTPEAAFRWGLASAVQSGINGLIWGATPVLFLDPAQSVSIISITITLIAMMGSAIGFLSTYRAAYISFIMPMTISLIGVLLLRAGSVGIIVALLVMLSVSSYLLLVQFVHKVSNDSLRMRFENMALRREAEEQSTLLETTLHSMEQGISLVDRDGRLRLWNPHFLDLLGLSQVDMGDPPHLPLIIQAADPPLQLYNGRTEYRRADGAIIEIRQRPMPDGGRVLTYTDISLIAERTEALLAANQELNQRHGQLEQAYQQLAHTQEQLIQSAKMASLGFLVAGVAHELNNPISFVHGNLEFIGEYTDRLARVIAAYSGAGQDDSPSRRTGDRQRDHLKVDATLDTLRELIASCQEGTERVKKIILDLRLFSRADATGPVLTDLHAGIEFTLTLLAKEYRDRLTVHRDYGALPRVECYAGQINQVFMNLLQNAAQAIPAKGDIWIKTALAGDRVTIAIRDNGVGIPEQNLSSIFDPFFTTKTVGAGTGLGLSISYGIIQKHGGSIRVTSQVNVGTEFTIELPLYLNRKNDEASPAAAG